MIALVHVTRRRSGTIRFNVDNKTTGVVAWLLEYKRWCEVQPDRMQVFSPLTQKVGTRL